VTDANFCQYCGVHLKKDKEEEREKDENDQSVEVKFPSIIERFETISTEGVESESDPISNLQDSKSPKHNSKDVRTKTTNNEGGFSLFQRKKAEVSPVANKRSEGRRGEVKKTKSEIVMTSSVGPTSPRARFRVRNTQLPLKEKEKEKEKDKNKEKGTKTLSTELGQQTSSGPELPNLEPFTLKKSTTLPVHVKNQINNSNRGYEGPPPPTSIPPPPPLTSFSKPVLKSRGGGD